MPTVRQNVPALTKRGEAGKVNVKFENTVGWSSRALPKYETASQEDYVQLSYEALRNNYEFGNGMDHAAAVAQARADLGCNCSWYKPMRCSIPS